MKKVFNILIYIFAVIGFGLTLGFFAVKFGLTDTTGVIDQQRENFLANAVTTQNPGNPDQKYVWNQDSEWQTLKSAILKDETVIKRSAGDAGVSPRLLVAELVVEQLRFYHTDRESFKKFFEPLKILGSQTQFSWGVMGVKEETAIRIERNLKETTSPFYLGKNYETMLDFKTADVEQERFVRMTDQHNHYWSYLYASLYMRQLMNQWQKAGFDISGRPEIVSTLYNIGFAHSTPNADPHSGGAAIEINGTTYSFGSLAAEFYNSSEMADVFVK